MKASWNHAYPVYPQMNFCYGEATHTVD
jgi:hypothetical protein